MRILEERPDLRARLDSNVLHNIILVTEGGSTAHGIADGTTEDTDWYGVYLEAPWQVVGLGEARTIVLRDKPEGVKSEPGDLDLTLHPLRKFTRLAIGGNPTILGQLFAPTIDYDPLGDEIRAEFPKHIVSRKAGKAFLGYLTQQKVRLVEGRSMRVNRPELIEKFGYDTKYAAHALRLGMQGVELLTHGSIMYPMQSPYLELVRVVRHGELSKTSAIEHIEDYEGRLERLMAFDKLNVRDEPDWEWANYYLQSVLLSEWTREAGGYQ